MRRIVISFLILGAICGCTHTELTRRYHSKDFGSAPRNYVQVSAFVMDTPLTAPDTLVSQLTPQGQQGFMDAVAGKSKDLEQIYQALLYKGKSQEGDERTIDKTVFRKRVVFSVEKEPPGKGGNDLTLADRINQLKVTLKLPRKEDEKSPKKHDSYFAFMNKLETKYGSVNLGQLTRTQKTAAGFEMTIGTPAESPVSVSGKPSVSSEKSIAEMINLQQRYIDISGTIKRQNKEAELLQESPVGYDLTGNFAVDLVIKIRKRKHSGIIILGEVEKGSKPLTPEEVEISFGHLIYPVSSESVKCALTSTYTIRHVVKHDREIAEGFHSVRFIRGKANGNDVELISNRELKTIVYKIIKGDQRLYLGRPVNYPGETGETIDINPIWFTNFEKAKKFLSWIKLTKSIKIGKYEIYAEHGPIKKGDIRHLRIKAEVLN